MWQKCHTATEMQRVEEANEKEDAAEASTLYQALRGSRSDPTRMTYASLTDANREGTGASAKAAVAGPLLSAPDEDVTHASETDYEIMAGS